MSMTIEQALKEANSLQGGNKYDEEIKIKWLSRVDMLIANEIIRKHEDGKNFVFGGYDEDTPKDTELLVPEPYCSLYIHWLISQINLHNQDYERYNSATSAFYAAYESYAEHYNREHMPIKHKSGRYVAAYNEEKPLKIERKIPDLDYVCECNNRIWGCKWDGTINEIYSATQGDPKNWTKYLGTSQDSYNLTVGSDGRFTGIAVQNGTVLFFKENFIHKLYGSKPSNFQTSDIMGRGIKLGCGKSAVIANETLYYLSKNGICQYGGGTPSGIYAPFGGVIYSDAVGGKCGDKYYVSMKDKTGAYSLFCFDEALQMWFKEDDTQVRFFAEDKGILYFINANNELWVTDAENYDGEFPIAETEGHFEWFAETGDIGIQEPDCKIYRDIQIRLCMEPGSEVAVYLQYDSDGNWHQEALWKDKAKGAYTIPIVTPKVDHMKIRIEGKGNAKIYSISKRYEDCSEVRGNEY